MLGVHEELPKRLVIIWKVAFNALADRDCFSFYFVNYYFFLARLNLLKKSLWRLVLTIEG